MLTLHLTKAKIFFDNSSGAERRFISAASNKPVQVPNWVKGTLGYVYGVKDGSITDLTPPKQYATAPAAIKLPDADITPEIAATPEPVTDDEVEALIIPEDVVEKSEADLEDELVAHTQPGGKGPSAGAGMIGGKATKRSSR